MSNPQPTLFTSKKNTDVLESSSEAIVGLQRMTESELAKVAATQLTSLRERLLDAGAIAAADQSAETECSATSKRAGSNLEFFNKMVVCFGTIIGSEALTSIVTDGDNADVAEKMIMPALEALPDPTAKALVALGDSLVKDWRAAKKNETKATAKADASNAKWSDLYGDIVERVREGRALQTVNGLDVPKAKRKPGAGRTKTDPTESTPVDTTRASSSPTPVPAPGPVNAAPSTGTQTDPSPPVDATKVAG